MKALILAGGKGTRLSSLTKDEIPKPMCEINGKPIIEYAIENLKQNNITEIIISVGHLHHVIENYFGDGSKFGVSISYIVEDTPLGSGGCLYYLKNKIKETFLICPGDAIFDVDISKIIAFHKEKKADVTIFSHPNLHPYDSDLLHVDSNDCVEKIDLKNQERNYYYNNNVIAGMFLVEPSTLAYFKELKKVNMEHDFISSLLSSKKVFAYKSPEYFKDVGTPERFELTSRDLLNKIVANKNLNKKQKAIFLDRDGTINIYKGFINSADQIELIKNVPEAIKKINNSGYLAIVISNQPVIARGECSFEEVDTMFKKIETLLGYEGAYLDDIYYCPHHPHSGYEGEVKELKIKCDCRKPNVGLINKAIKKYNIDLSQSYMVGDTNNDVQTAINSGMRSVRVKSSHIEEEPIKANIEATDLLEAINIILGE